MLRLLASSSARPIAWSSTEFWGFKRVAWYCTSFLESSIDSLVQFTGRALWNWLCSLSGEDARADIKTWSQSESIVLERNLLFRCKLKASVWLCSSCWIAFHMQLSSFAQQSNFFERNREKWNFSFLALSPGLSSWSSVAACWFLKRSAMGFYSVRSCSRWTARVRAFMSWFASLPAHWLTIKRESLAWRLRFVDGAPSPEAPRVGRHGWAPKGLVSIQACFSCIGARLGSMSAEGLSALVR